MIRWVNRPRKASAKAYWQNPTWTTRWRRWNRRWWREREKESATSARARWCWSFGGNFEPLVRSKSLLLRNAHRSLSLSLLFERFQSSRERDERETSALFRRERFRLSTLSLNAFLQISFPIKSSSHSNKSESISLSRERKCLACVVKWEIRNPRQSAFTRTRKQSESDTIVPFVQAKTFYYV